MRVIGGSLRGRSLAAPAGRDTRPTSDRVREALFSRLEALLGCCEGARVLDAFAGSGALGIEALSRGAERAVFVDQSSAALRALRRNIEILGLQERSTVVQDDAFRPSSWSRLREEQFTLLFLDPPYRISESEVRTLVESFARGSLLSRGAVVVWEYASGGTPEWPDGFRSLGPRRYGSTEVDIAVADEPGRGE